MLARAFSGRCTEPLTVDVDLGDPLAAVRRRSEIEVTLPTATSLTLTADCGTRSSTSANSMVTVYGWSPRSAPPGSEASRAR